MSEHIFLVFQVLSWHPAQTAMPEKAAEVPPPSLTYPHHLCLQVLCSAFRVSFGVPRLSRA